MQQRRATNPEEGEAAGPSSHRSHAGGDVPLLIVSESGRHSHESRRIVRAQAARASAAQSRVTRARNREEREGTIREAPLSPSSPYQVSPTQPQGRATHANVDTVNRPLVVWLSGLIHVPVATLTRNATSGSMPSAGNAALAVSTNSLASLLGSTAGASGFRPRLPLAVPRGLIALQQRVQISEHLMVLISRTACFDFDSRGVQERLNQLLSDLIIGQPGSVTSNAPLPGHRIQEYLRVACTCLTIFQGRRVDGVGSGEVSNYQNGLDAARSEAMMLDWNALYDPNTAPAALWSAFIINVTTGARAADFLRQLLHRLFEDLQLSNWPQVRAILLEFIYPSFLNEPCQLFYNDLFLA